MVWISCIVLVLESYLQGRLVAYGYGYLPWYLIQIYILIMTGKV